MLFMHYSMPVLICMRDHMGQRQPKLQGAPERIGGVSKESTYLHHFYSLFELAI
tara:strand:- start:55 stop:216 length:162 start_codon:yes stop_codon:yes gene_type:complete